MTPTIVILDNGGALVVEAEIDGLLRVIMERRGTSTPFISTWTMKSDFNVWMRKGLCYIDVHAIDALETHDMDLPKGTF